MKYVIGIIVIAVGFLLIWRSNWLVNNIGRIGWADEHLGSEGGSNLLYKIIGLILIIGTFATLSGCTQSLLLNIFGAGFDTSQ
ncbi:hypothetical protein ACFL04_03230 [Patescibacteria group bacterium]